MSVRCVSSHLRTRMKTPLKIPDKRESNEEKNVKKKTTYVRVSQNTGKKITYENERKYYRLLYKYDARHKLKNVLQPRATAASSNCTARTTMNTERS